MTNKFSIEFTVGLHDAGPGAIIKIPTLFNYLQGAAGAHTNSLNIKDADIQQRGYTWVISRYRLSIIKLPKFLDKFILTTWNAGTDEKYAIRDSIISDKSSNDLIRVTSSWILINFIKRVSVPATELYSDYPTNPERAIDDKFLPIPEVSHSHYEKEFVARKYDLDMNNHVNNSIYAACVIETGEDMNEGKKLKDISLNFKGEARYGDTIISEAMNDNNENNKRIIHRLKLKNTGKEITRAITEWE
ncbi:MAG: thioesterase [Leptospirales bacterium]|nr:thioesterase [Leptospirales bacterium]